VNRNFQTPRECADRARRALSTDFQDLRPRRHVCITPPHPGDRDLTGVLATVAAVLRPGGWFVASVVHPCLPGSERGASSWPPGQGYEYEWWISVKDNSPEGVRIRVGATHRKLSTYLNALIDAGLEAERFAEPPAPVPTYLLWRCRRQ
jgi:hypothetical protein